MLIDTHGHVDLPQFDSDRDDVIARAVDAGVERIIDPGIHLESSRSAVALAEKHDAVYAAVGVHAHDVDTFDGNTIDELAKLAQHPKVVAIGEIGLDHYRDYAPHDVQETVFREQVRLARDIGKPLIVHSRAAEQLVIDILKEEHADEVRGVLHCWGGSLEEAQEAWKLGFHIGFGGVVTFKKADRLDVALALPIESILLETDAPYMAPVPHRGKRNEPAFTKHVAEKLATAGGRSFEDVERTTTANACTLFGLDECP